jgi:hypothetical protein
MKQGGAYAVSSGRILEGIVENALITKGLQVVTYKEWVKNKAAYSEELLIKKVPYEGLYKHSSHTEFLVLSKEHNIHTRIECKWQQSSGSVDEKLPYLFLNCTEKMIEPHIIVLLDGGGAKQGAIDWFKSSCENFNNQHESISGRRVELMCTVEFLQWVNKTFR